jgi:hypothetical protein
MRRWVEISRVYFPSRSGLRPLKSPTDEDLRHFKSIHGRNSFNCAILVSSWVSLLADCPCTGPVSRRTGQRFYFQTFSTLLETIARYSQLADELTLSVTHTDFGTSIGFIDSMKNTPIFSGVPSFLSNWEYSVVSLCVQLPILWKEALLR